MQDTLDPVTGQHFFEVLVLCALGAVILSLTLMVGDACGLGLWQVLKCTVAYVIIAGMLIAPALAAP